MIKRVFGSALLIAALTVGGASAETKLTEAQAKALGADFDAVLKKHNLDSTLRISKIDLGDATKVAPNACYEICTPWGCVRYCD